MQILFANIVEGANDPALEDTPKALNRLGVNRSYDVLMFGMVNCAVREAKAEVLVANPLIGADQTNTSRPNW